MSIATAITAAQTKVANAYTAVNSKGGTLPATQNLTNLPTAINSIPSGSGSSTKYGANMDNILGDVNASGVIQKPTGQADIVFTGVQDVSNMGLSYAFYGKSSVKTLTFPNLTQISGSSGLSSMFTSCTSLTSASFPELTTISGANAFMQTFYGCTALTSVSFSKLATLSNSGSYSYALYQTFQGCTNLTSVSFPELTTISGGQALSSCFYGCTKLASISFPKLTTISNNTAFGNSTYNYMFYNCTALRQIHFKSTASSAVMATSGYSTKWGATNATIYFDL